MTLFGVMADNRLAQMESLPPKLQTGFPAGQLYNTVTPTPPNLHPLGPGPSLDHSLPADCGPLLDVRAWASWRTTVAGPQLLWLLFQVGSD